MNPHDSAPYPYMNESDDGGEQTGGVDADFGAYRTHRKLKESWVGGSPNCLTARIPLARHPFEPPAPTVNNPPSPVSWMKFEAHSNGPCIPTIPRATARSQANIHSAASGKRLVSCKQVFRASNQVRTRYPARRPQVRSPGDAGKTRAAWRKKPQGHAVAVPEPACRLFTGH